MVDRQIPDGIKDILEDLNATDERQFELRRNQLRNRVDLLLDTKGEVDKDGVRTTPKTDVTWQSKRYSFWVTEEEPTVLESTRHYASDFLVVVQPVEVGHTQAVIAYKISARGVTDILGYTIDDEDTGTLELIEQVVSYFEKVLPDIKDKPAGGEGKTLRRVKTRKDSNPS